MRYGMRQWIASSLLAECTLKRLIGRLSLHGCPRRHCCLAPHPRSTVLEIEPGPTVPGLHARSSPWRVWRRRRDTARPRRTFDGAISNRAQRRNTARPRRTFGGAISNRARRHNTARPHRTFSGAISSRVRRRVKRRHPGPNARRVHRNGHNGPSHTRNEQTPPPCASGLRKRLMHSMLSCSALDHRPGDLGPGDRHPV